MLRDSDLVSIQEVRAKVEKAYAAFQKYRSYSQEKIDAIVEAMGAAGRAHARRLRPSPPSPRRRRPAPSPSQTRRR